jgi:formylglycine-generating enzyme required for sulfatase activity
MRSFISRAKTVVLIPILVWLIFFGLVYQNPISAEDTSQKKFFTNSLGMKFVYIHSGSFMMGSSLNPLLIENRYGGKAKWYSDECPQHEVTLTKSFYMQTTEVTQKQWLAVLGNNPSGFLNCGENCPVEKVSWDDVQKFIKRLNQKEGSGKYRLPTEAEWEYACRAGSTTAFCFGNDIGMLAEHTWFGANSIDWSHQAGQKKPNAWGLYDMHGNVWEWCQDWYGIYPSEPVRDPKGPPSGSHRVSKGGSWRSAARFCRSAHRYGVDPGYRRPTRGFRLVKDP